MKTNNIRNLVFWGMMTLMLIVGIVLYMSNSAANAVVENVVETEETGATRWICGDEIDAYMRAKRHANDIYTGHIRDTEFIGMEYDSYLDAWIVTRYCSKADCYYMRHFYCEDE